MARVLFIGFVFIGLVYAGVAFGQGSGFFSFVAPATLDDWDARSNGFGPVTTIVDGDAAFPEFRRTTQATNGLAASTGLEVVSHHKFIGTGGTYDVEQMGPIDQATISYTINDMTIAGIPGVEIQACV